MPTPAYVRDAITSLLLLAAPLAAGAATITVTTAADVAGACPGAQCSLRSAIDAAGPGGTVLFDPALLPATITLAGSELLLAANVSLLGPGADRLVVQAAANRRVLRVSGGSAVLEGISLRGGSQLATNGLSGQASGSAGQAGSPAAGGCVAVAAAATLTLLRSAIADCEARGGDGGNGAAGASSSSFGVNAGNGGTGGAGGTASGGAILVDGTLALLESSVSDSIADAGRGGNGGNGGAHSTVGNGGNGGTGGTGAAARGGGIFVSSTGTLLLRNSTVSAQVIAGGLGGSGGSGGSGTNTGNGGAGGAGGLAEGGGLYISAGATVDVEFSSLGPAASSPGAGGQGGNGDQNGFNGVSGIERGEAFSSASNAMRLRHSVATGTDAASDCHGTVTASGSNFGGDGASCSGFALSGAHATNFIAIDAGGRQLLRPLAGAAVVDAAADCLDLAGAAVAVDQAGTARPTDGDGNGAAQCDPGAAEYTVSIFRNGFE